VGGVHEKNGAARFEEMKARIEAYSASAAQPGHRVGCIMVSQPVFFSDGDWIAQPRQGVLQAPGKVEQRFAGGDLGHEHHLRSSALSPPRQRHSHATAVLCACAGVASARVAVGAPEAGARSMGAHSGQRGAQNVVVPLQLMQVCWPGAQVAAGVGWDEAVMEGAGGPA
jgi:hypothetical protein